MTYKQLKETRDIYNITEHIGPDSKDLRNLLVASLALVILNQTKKRNAQISMILSHFAAIFNGLLGINTARRDNGKIFIILWYLPALLFFAKQGFDAQKKTQALRTELANTTSQHKSLKDIVINSDLKQLHDIAKMYRKEIPTNTDQDITPEAIQNAVHNILMKYER